MTQNERDTVECLYDMLIHNTLREMDANFVYSLHKNWQQRTLTPFQRDRLKRIATRNGYPNMLVAEQCPKPSDYPSREYHSTQIKNLTNEIDTIRMVIRTLSDRINKIEPTVKLIQEDQLIPLIADNRATLVKILNYLRVNFFGTEKL